MILALALAARALTSLRSSRAKKRCLVLLAIPLLRRRCRRTEVTSWCARQTSPSPCLGKEVIFTSCDLTPGLALVSVKLSFLLFQNVCHRFQFIPHQHISWLSRSWNKGSHSTTTLKYIAKLHQNGNRTD